MNQKIMTNTQRKRLSTDASLNVTQTLELSEEDFKAATITMLLEIKVNTLEMNKSEVLRRKRDARKWDF